MNAPARIGTGIRALDEVLAGGLHQGRVYLIEGTPGAGKTTLALQFLLEGVAQHQKALYFTLSESADELNAVAGSHGWSLDGIEIRELIDGDGLDPNQEQSILHPSELELGEAIHSVIQHAEASRPVRVVFDSLSELRLLAQNPLRYRRQVLALKRFFTGLGSTVLLLDDRSGDHPDLGVHSVAHGVIVLEQITREYGAERRRLQVLKQRGSRFCGGWHDYAIVEGGLALFPRLVARDHHIGFEPEVVSTGAVGLDALLGGGLRRGTNTLLLGPSGAGKTSTATSAVMAALGRGERAAYFLFDEVLESLLLRSASIGMDLRPYLATGQLVARQVDPAEMSPGEFVVLVRDAVEERGATIIVIDSLNSYLQSMPGEQFLLLQMHELLSYLNQSGTLTMLVLGQHGLLGDVRASIDLSYLADTVVLLRFFEVDGAVRKAISVLKTRTTVHEATIREFNLGPSGLVVSETLTGFRGVLSGHPIWTGADADLMQSQGKTGE